MLTERVKSLAVELGADLVGIAPVERWSKAPIEHSPQGILPVAESVVVCGIHTPDACIELGAEEDPRKPGPALGELDASSHLQFLAFRLAKYLQEQGWSAIPISQSGYWSYRPREGAPRGWISDMSHYYAAVAAGLGEIGLHNLCITPEFGTRQRFVSIVTDAPLKPDPMYEGESLCDKCLLCAKYCPTESFDKEVCGECTVEIGGKEFNFPNRNLWRCAIGENFQLDVFLPWPDKIDEKVITEMVEKAAKEHPEWVYGWKMGICFKYCVPPRRRYFDKEYCKSPRRKRDVVTEKNEDTSKRLMNEILALTEKTCVDIVGVANVRDFKNEGVDLKTILPDAESAIVIGLGYPENCSLNIEFFARRAQLWIARHIEKYGFSALTYPDLSSETAALICGVAQKGLGGRIVTSEFGERQVWRTIITSAPLPKSTGEKSPVQPPKRNHYSTSLLTEKVKAVALSEGADLIGIAPVKRINGIFPFLEEIAEAEKDYFVVEDRGWEIRGTTIWGGQAMPYNPEVKYVKLSPKRPQDYLSGAKSVIVIGLHLLEASIDRAGKPPAQKAGHYAAFTHGEAFNQLSYILLKIAKFLDGYGYKVFPSFDLCDLASRVCGERFDLTASRFAAVAAGLGEIGWNGLVLTPEFGPRQRFATLITDAPLEYSGLYDGPPLCKRCFKCADSCPAKAISREESLSIEIEGKKFEWGKTDRLRCDWAKRYGLLGGEGPKFIGSYNDFEPPEVITPEKVCDAVKKSDRLQRPSGYVSIVERCFTNCSSQGG
ncbi:MAG: hypothetical protein ACUVXI_18150 [bacterium]